MRAGSEPVFDVAPLHDPTIKHVLHGRLPIPPGAAIGQQAGIADWIIDAQVFIDPVVISKGAVIQHLDLIHWREYGQWALVLVQCISPAPDGVNLDGIVLGSVELLDGLLWLARGVERDVYIALKDVGQWVFLEGCQTLQVAFMGMAI